MVAENPNQSMLTLEQMNSLASNFELIGELFNGNTENDAETGGRVTPGHGNMNFIASPVGVPDIDPLEWNKGKSFGDAAMIGLYTSGSDFLMQDKPVALRDRERAEIPGSERWAGRLEVALASGRKIYTDHFVFTTGFGKSLYPFKDVETLALIAEEEKRVDFLRPHEVPDVTSFETMMRYAQLSHTPLEPYRHLANGRTPHTAMIGDGDGSRVALQLLMRQAPQGAYTGRTPAQTESAQRGQVGPIHWFVGPGGPVTAPEFRSRTWDRYIPLATKIENGHITNVPAFLATIHRITGGEDAGRLALGYELASGEEKTLVEDKVVISTGFRTTTSEVVASLVPGLDTKIPLEKNPEATEIIFGKIAEFAEPKPIARKVKGSPVYMAGPAAGQDLVNPETDLDGVSKNPISIFALGHRSVALGEQLAVPVGVPVRKFTWKNSERTALQAKAGSASASITAPATLPVVDPWAAFQLRVAFAAALAPFAFPAKVALDLTLRRGKIEVHARGLDANAAQTIAAAIEAQPRLAALAGVLLRPGQSRRIAVRAEVGSDGAIKVPSLTVRI
jgi:hypothetical protein